MRECNSSKRQRRRREKINTTRIEVKTKSGFVPILEYERWMCLLGTPKEVNS